MRRNGEREFEAVAVWQGLWGGRGWLRRRTRRTSRRGWTRGLTLTLTSTFHDHHHHHRTAFNGQSWVSCAFQAGKAARCAGLVWSASVASYTHTCIAWCFFPAHLVGAGFALLCLGLGEGPILATRTGNLSTSWTDEGHGWDSNGRGWHLGPDGLELELGLRPTSVVRRGEGGPSVLCGLAESIE